MSLYLLTINSRHSDLETFAYNAQLCHFGEQHGSLDLFIVSRRNKVKKERQNINIGFCS
jgi:hypothetical protein